MYGRLLHIRTGVKLGYMCLARIRRTHEADPRNHKSYASRKAMYLLIFLAEALRFDARIHLSASVTSITRCAPASRGPVPVPLLVYPLSSTLLASDSIMSFIPPPHIPTPQGLHCPTFQPPTLDGTLNVAQIIEYNATHSPKHRVFVFLNDDGSIRTICYPEVWRMVTRAAGIITRHINRAHDRLAAQTRPPGQGVTVAILASAGTVKGATTTSSSVSNAQSQTL